MSPEQNVIMKVNIKMLMSIWKLLGVLEIFAEFHENFQTKLSLKRH